MDVTRTWQASAWRGLVQAHHLGEAVLIAFAFISYYLVRGLVVERVDEALERAERLISLEQRLGLFVEPTAQAWVLSRPLLMEAANSMYLYGHGPVILAFAVLLYLRSRPNYLLMRNAFLISGGIGLILYYTLPTAPPRFMPEHGFVDTIFESYGMDRVLMPSFVKNQYAAVPSLHFGWNALLGLGIWLAFPNIWARTFAVVMPIAMLVAIVVTANHFVLDAVAGGLVVGVGLGAALLIRRQAWRLSKVPAPTGRRRALVSFTCWLGGAQREESGEDEYARV